MKRFLAAAAIAPLCFAAVHAQAQTTISDAQTTPVQTSVTGDLTTTASGSITVKEGAIVTLDSNNTVTNNGLLNSQDSTTSATGILITSGSGTVVSSGVINVTDTDTLKDLDGDGDIDGPYVTSTATRYGIRLTSPFTGSITQSAGQILLRGNNSAGVQLDGALTGNLLLTGQIVVLGDHSYGVLVNAPITGSFTYNGTSGLSATGAGAEGIFINAPVSGIVNIGGAVSATGFRYNSPAVSPGVTKLDADDLLIGGSAVHIASSVGGGVLINGTAPDADTNNNDEDGDGVADNSETTGVLSSVGSAPALNIGSSGAITLGNVGTGKSAYGLVIQGNVVGTGSFDGVSSTAAKIGGAGGSVNTSSGIYISGNVAASASLANSNGLVLGSGAIAPTLITDGRIQAIGTSSSTVSPTVTALQIDAGASLGSLTNNGSILAQITGPTGSANAIVDTSGSLSQITNTGGIAASFQQSAATDVITGRAIALDLRANSTGVTVVQSANTSETVTPQIIGDVLFGSGGANLTINQGSITGDVAFGTGVNSLVIDGHKTTTNADSTTTTVINGSITGKLTNAGSLSVSVLNGTLKNTAAGTVNLTSLTTGAGGQLGFTIDPQAASGSQATRYNVSGAANLATGSKIDIAFASKLTGAATYNLVEGASVSNGAVLGTTPFVYNAALTTTPTQINLTVSRRTAAEAGLFGSRAAAYDAVFNAFDSDAGVAAALLGKTDAAGFAGFYNQLLPDYGGGAFRSLATGARAVMKAQVEEPAGQDTNQRRSWLQEVGFTTQNDGEGGELKYDTAGFGLAGGLEQPSGARGTLGLSAAFLSSDVDNAGRLGDSRLTADALIASIYYRNRVTDRLLLSGSLTGGFAWFDSDRHVIDTDATGARVLQRQAGGKWNGGLAAARLGASYEAPLGGHFYIRPEAFLDYVYLYEQGYTEHGGGSAIDLVVSSRSSYEAAAEAALTVGARYGRVVRWGPELKIGYRTRLAEGLSDTTARFLAGGNPFLMRALGVDQNRLIVRAAVRGGSRYANLALELGGEIGDVYTAYDGRLVVRFIF